LTGIRRDGEVVPFTRETIKGITYAVFVAEEGAYVAEYGIDTAAPIVSNVVAAPSHREVIVSWLTNEPASSRVDFGLAPDALTSTASVEGTTMSHAVTLRGLSSATTYYYRAVSVDGGALAGFGPLQSVATVPMATALAVSDRTVGDFSSGEVSAEVRIANVAGGEVELGSGIRTDFGGDVLPSGWTATPWGGGGAALVSGGQLVVDGALAATAMTYGPGRSLEFVSTFGSDGFQHVGYALSFNEDRWAIFSTGSGGELYARTHNGAAAINTPLSGSWLDAPHRFRIDWSSTEVIFLVDDVVVATHVTSITEAMRPVASDFAVGGQPVRVDWLGLTPPFAAAGIFTSRVLDAGLSASWTLASWTATHPAGAGSAIAVRFGDTPQPDETWTPFQPVAASGSALAQVSRYAQYQATLTSNGDATPSLADVTLTAGPGTPGLSVGDAIVTEGEAGTANLVFTVSLPWPTAAEVRVNYATASGTATVGTDFVPASGTAIIPAGATSTIVAVTVLGDTALEGDETVLLNLSGAVGATIADAQGVGTIFNDDLPVLTIAGGAVTEGASPTATFVVTLSAPTIQTVQVAFSTAGGSAAAGLDFQPMATTVTLPPGATSATVAVPIVNDGIDELDETFTATLSSAIGAAVGSSSATATIVDDDPTPTVTVTAPVVTESNAAQAVTFTATLSNPSSQPITINYATVNGTATAPSDYTATSGVVTFAAGTTSQVFTVTIAGDTLDEDDETFVVTLANPVAAVLGGAQVTTTIVDDDPLPTLTVADATAVPEGNSGSVNAVFTVNLAAASGRSVAVSYATANGTAAAPNDYTASSGTLTFAPGTTSQTIVVPVVGDTLDEPNETFVVNLTSPVGATISDGQGAASITDNDPTVSIVIGNVTVTEGNSGTSNASFPVTLSTASGFTVTVNYVTASGTASAPSDYTSQSGTLSFAPGVTTHSVVVPIVGDLTTEAQETFAVNLSGATNATIADSQATGTIADNDPPPTISIGNVSVTEGNSGTANASFAVTLSAASGFTVTVNYATANGTATASSDYSTRTGTVSFAPGTTAQTISVPIAGDTTNEPTESFVVNLSAPSNATIADAQAIGTIADNDTVSLSINNPSVTEGNSGTQNMTFTVTKTGATVQTVTVAYATANGTAVQPGDYSSRSGTLTFSAGTATQSFTVPIVGDTLDEDNETVLVNLSGATVAVISDNQGVGTITDNDASPNLSINNATVTEGNSGTVNATFTVSLSFASGRAVTVNYATANVNAVSPNDYAARSGTVTFPAGTTAGQTIVVPVSGDTLDEPNETFVVNLSGAVGAGVSDSQGVGTINDDDPSPSLRIDNASLTEGSSGTANMNFTVTLSAASGQAVTVNYATANGTATQPADYSSRSGTLTIAAGTTTQTISVPVVGDTMDEPNETFVVNLTNASGATIADNQATGTITDNDPAPTLSVNDISVNESTFFSSTATFTVSLSAASSQQVTVNYATANGTATAGSDYTARSGTLTFAPGTTTQTVQITIAGDFSDEPSETFFLNLSGATVVTIADNQGRATIVDND
jgi:ribosomal protein L35AE/L33A